MTPRLGPPRRGVVVSTATSKEELPVWCFIESLRPGVTPAEFLGSADFWACVVVLVVAVSVPLAERVKRWALCGARPCPVLPLQWRKDRAVRYRDVA
jgi:hypothetical protein